MRPFCIATIGTILGIIMGLYLKSIALFVLLIILTTLIITCFLKKKFAKNLCIFFICTSLFVIYTNYLENRYEEINREYTGKEVLIRAVVVSNKTEKEYKDTYKIKVLEIESTKEMLLKEQTNKPKKKYIINSNFTILLNVKREKEKTVDLSYGEEICFTAIYEEPSSARNTGGFDYKQYLKTQHIAGIMTVKSNEIRTEGKTHNSIEKIINNIKQFIIEKVNTTLPKNTSNLCTALVLGEKQGISEDIQESFRKSNLSHMLAISGAHVSYFLLAISTAVQKLKLHKRWCNIGLIIFLIFFAALVEFTPSVTRSCIMAILQLLANILFKRSDTYQNLAISSFIILLLNPYAILDIGFQLSFGGTIGIIIFSKRIFKREEKSIKDESIKLDDEDNSKIIKSNFIWRKNTIIQKVLENIKQICIVTLSANIIIIPIMMYHFNTISLTFIISNLLASPILGIALILSMTFILSIIILYPISKFISLFLHPILQLLIKIAQLTAHLPFSQILVQTPKLWQIFVYYIIISIMFFLRKTKIQVFIKYKKEVIILLIFIILLPYIAKTIPTNTLSISFIDVGQGDSMLIHTPSRKTILIDGGGSDTGSFDVGEKTLLPYLLDKGILKIDYLMFSHFDSDHCKRTIYYN